MLSIALAHTVFKPDVVASPAQTVVLPIDDTLAECTLLYSDTKVEQAAPTTYDLSDLVNALGEAVSFTQLRLLVLRNNSPACSLVITTSVTDLPIGTIKSRGMLLFVAEKSAPWYVGSGEGITVTPDGSQGAGWDCIVIGA